MSIVASICGDGVVSAPETCDDNNTANGDGCSNTCSLEAASCSAVSFSPTSLIQS